MLKFKLTALATLLAASLPVYSDPMQDIFNGMYSTSTPGVSQLQNGRYGVNLGGFSYRPPRSEVGPIVSARTPNLSVGDCGDIDFFAGSFSMISGDELSQVGRGIMQGAATYAFKIAIDSISPMAGSVMSELQDLINQVNRFNIDGCRIGQKLASEVYSGDATPQQESNALSNALSNLTVEVGGAADTFDGYFGPGAGKSASDKAAETGAKITMNSAFKAFEDIEANGAFFNTFGPVKKFELVMSLLGTTVTSTDPTECTAQASSDEKTCINPYPSLGTEFLVNFFFDPQNVGSNTETFAFKYYRCNNADCTSISTATTTTSRLLPKLRKDIYNLWQKLVHQPNQPLTTNEAKLMQWFGADMLSMMKTFGTDDYFAQSYSEFLAYKAVVSAMNYTMQDVITTTKNALDKQTSTMEEGAIFPVGMGKLSKNVDEVRNQYNDFIEKSLNPKIAEYNKSLQTISLLQLISKSR
ncbi:conjugal transfer protein TraH [Shewanella algae]